MLRRDRVGPPLALAAVAGAVTVAALWCGGVATSQPKRVAIRVECGELAQCAFAEAFALDVWSEERGPHLPLDLVVTDDVLPRLTAAGVPWQTLVPDIDAAARDEAARLRSPAAQRPGDWFAEYHDYEAITARLRMLAASAPDRVALEAIGGSSEGRPIWALRIGRGASHVLVDGTQHAREWLAAAATTCVADRLVTEYAANPAIRDFVDRHELWIVPVANPDGYQYSWGSDRYWRKNRHGKFGVDLNRNYSVAFGGAGSSGLERSETYRGAYAFSEPESAALRDLTKREAITLNIDFHTYSQLVLYPWNYTAAPAGDRDRFAAIGDRMVTAMYATHQTAYKLMQGVELYPSAGTMSDWMYGEAKARAYAIELRPAGRFGGGRGGFVAPPDQIRPTCDEALAAVLALPAAEPARDDAP